MLLDNTDYKIIIDALYNPTISNSADLSDDISGLDDDELEQRVLKLREHFSKLKRKSSYEQ